MGAGTVNRDRNDVRPGKVLYFEWARCLGASAVVMIHVTSGIMDNLSVSEVGTARALIWSLMQVALLRWAVPVFLMMTGALLLDSDKKVDWSKVLGYIRRMVLVLLTWGLAFCLMQRAFIERTFTPGMLAGAFLDLLSNKGFSHLWYVYTLIGIYLLLPLLRSWIATADERDKRILLIVLFVFTCVVPTLNAAMGLEITTFVWFTSSVFYVLIGHYVHNRLELNGRLLAVGVGSLAACMALKAYGIVMVGEYWKWLHGPACPLEAIWSLCVFLLMKRHLNRPYERGGLVERVASLSLGIYVVHPLFINLLYKVLDLGPWSMPPIIFELTMWAVAFLGSALLVFAERKVPILRDIM